MSDELFFFQVNPSSGEPIYRQLIQQVERLIVSGQLAPGAVLPSVRQVAAKLDVNPMTISKAYSLLEAQGLVSRQRGKGMQVNAVAQSDSEADRLELLKPLAQELAQQCQQLSIDKDHAILWLADFLKKDAV